MCGFSLELVYNLIIYFWAYTGDLNGSVQFIVSMLCG